MVTASQTFETISAGTPAYGKESRRRRSEERPRKSPGHLPYLTLGKVP